MADTPESAQKARDMKEEYRSASCEDVARRVDECMALRAERDDLAAMLSELDGQEPVAWMGFGPRDGRAEFSIKKPAGSVMRDFNMRPVFARPAPAEPVNARLLAVATGKIPHLYEGRCPDYVNGPESRDPDCPACQAIAAAEAQQERLLQDMHDAGREVDRVMAEAAPKAVRLTEEELRAAWASGSHTFQCFQKIQNAVLRANGFKVEG
jgi:hypothetical protein